MSESSISHENADVLDRVLSEVRAAEAHLAATTEHSVYVSGLFEDGDKCDVLERVLSEVRAAEGHSAPTTEHSVYVTGLFEDDQG